MNKIRVLFVCHGNICRSPMVRAICREKIFKMNLFNQIQVDSAGTHGYFHSGENADYRTIQVLKNHNISIEHSARQLVPSDFDSFDYIIAMDKKNLADIKHSQSVGKKNDSSAKITLLSAFGLDNEYEVEDPYYGNMETFEELYYVLDKLTDEFLNTVKILTED
jgi:protein-tyrosine-phosphatase